MSRCEIEQLLMRAQHITVADCAWLNEHGLAAKMLRYGNHRLAQGMLPKVGPEEQAINHACQLATIAISESGRVGEYNAMCERVGSVAWGTAWDAVYDHKADQGVRVASALATRAAECVESAARWTLLFLFARPALAPEQIALFAHVWLPTPEPRP